MTMNAGTVTVDDDEVATGEGLAKEMYDADVATLTLETPPTEGDDEPPYSPARPATAADVSLAAKSRLRGLRERARVATAYASAIVAHLTDNAQAKIANDGTADGLQDGTTHPSAIKYLPIV